MVDAARTTPALPPQQQQDYPADPSKYYIDSSRSSSNAYSSSAPSRHSGGKRSIEPPTAYGAVSGPPSSKQPRLDTWRMAIDQQIQQRLTTAQALHEQQKRQEMSLPVPLPNGTLVSQNAYERTEATRGTTADSRYPQYPPSEKREQQQYHHHHHEAKTTAMYHVPPAVQQPPPSSQSYSQVRATKIFNS